MAGTDTQQRTYTHSQAVISACGTYRYSLTRRWDGLDPDDPAAYHVLWIMLNPSTADHAVDDATIRRVDQFSRRIAFDAGGFTVINLFAWRARQPGELWVDDGRDVVGPDNEAWAAKYRDDRRVEYAVAAWGNGGVTRGRADTFLAGWAGAHLSHLDQLTNFRQPRHPLYLSADAPLGNLWESLGLDWATGKPLLTDKDDELAPTALDVARLVTNSERSYSRGSLVEALGDIDLVVEAIAEAVRLGWVRHADSGGEGSYRPTLAGSRAVLEADKQTNERNPA